MRGRIDSAIAQILCAPRVVLKSALGANARLITRATLVSDSYHSKRLKGIASELGIDALVSPTDGSPTIPELARETALVSLGQIIGYGRLLRFAS